MFGRLRFHDYRCFLREEPATLDLRPGLTSFIGPNNAGKSALIKALFEIRGIIGNLSNLHANPQALLSEYNWSIAPPVHEHTEIYSDREYPLCSIDIEPYLLEEEKFEFISRIKIEFLAGGTSFRCQLFSPDGLAVGTSESAISINSISGHSIGLSTGHTLSVRKLSSFIDLLVKSQYFGPFRNAINEGAGIHYDTAVGTGFISQWHQWKTGANKAQNRAIERVTEDIRRLIGANSLEINASNELKTLQVSIDKRPHKLQELGAGFSQLVVVLGNALIRNPSFILIDEPELHLHPGLQSDFLTTLATYASHGLLFTTHSMGLARLADHCYTVQRKEERSIVRPFDRTANYAEFLGSLGIAGLMDLGWDRILLVEGPKDVRTAQQLLRLYGKDRHTIVLPLGGGSMAHGGIAHELSEIRRLCNKVYALVDSERASADSRPIKERLEFFDVCKSLEIICCVTERRAMENYIEQSALDKAWKPKLYRALGPYDSPPKDGSFWGKSDSWKAARYLSREKFDNTDIGKFLASI